MKKNVLNCELTIPQYVKLVEQLNKENEALKEQLKNVPSTPAVVAESVTTICASCQGEKTEQKPQIEPHWKPILQSLLKEQSSLRVQILKLTNAEEVLSHRIILKKQTEYIATVFNDDDESQSVSNFFIYVSNFN